MSYRRSCWTYKTFTSIRLATQVMTKVSSDVRQTSPASRWTTWYYNSEDQNRWKELSAFGLCSLIMSRWWDYVSELRPPSCLLFIPQEIWKHGEPWWWCRLGITPDSSSRALCQSNQQSYMGTSRRNGRKSENFAYHYLKRLKGKKVKSYDMGLPALLPIRRKVCCGFLSPLEIHRLCRV
jgi:hypothetical protein